MAATDLTGKTFGRLTVIESAGHLPNGKSRGSAWLCQCKCGKTKAILAASLKAGRSKSCGCAQRESARKMAKQRTTHGHSVGRKLSRTYRVWADMWSRSTNPKCTHYGNYGGRGIAVCDRWREFTSFLSDMGEVPAGLTLDRIDNDGDYCSENCRWATRNQQARNKRNTTFITHNDETKCLAEWSEELGIYSETLRNRLKVGWCITCTLSLPAGGGKCTHR